MQLMVLCASLLFRVLASLDSVGVQLVCVWLCGGDFWQIEWWTVGTLPKVLFADRHVLLTGWKVSGRCCVRVRHFSVVRL